MAISLFGTPQKVYQASGATMTVNIPGGGVTLSADTIVIVHTSTRASGGTGCVTPSGWTLLTTVAVDSIDDAQIFYRVFLSGSSLPSTLAFSANDPGGFFQAGAVAVSYQGMNSSSPFDGSAVTTHNTGSASITAASYTTSLANSLVLWAFSFRPDESLPEPTLTQGTEEIAINRSVSSGTLYLDIVDEVFASAGGSGSNTFTASVSASIGISSITFALAVAPSGPPPPVIPSILTQPMFVTRVP